MYNALALDHAAYLVVGEGKNPVQPAKGAITIPEGGHIEIYWPYLINIVNVSVQSTPQVDWTLYYKKAAQDWILAGTQQSFTLNEYARALKLVPSAPCTVQLTVTTEGKILGVEPSEIVPEILDQPVQVNVATTISTPIVGWIEGAGWSVVVEAPPFEPISEAIVEGVIEVLEEVKKLEQDPTPSLPFTIEGYPYAYGPFDVFGTELSVASTTEEMALVSVEVGLIPLKLGKNTLPVPVTTAWIVTKEPAEITVCLPKYRFCRTSGYWQSDGSLAASDSLKAIVLLPPDYTENDLVTL